MDKETIISIIGSSGIMGIFTSIIFSKMRKSAEDSKALRRGVQALLRHELYEIYYEYAQNRKYAPVSVKEDFENMYEQYHSLGANGVMDGIHEEFKLLPTAPPQEGVMPNEHQG